MAVRSRHPNKEVEAVVAYAEVKKLDIAEDGALGPIVLSAGRPGRLPGRCERYAAQSRSPRTPHQTVRRSLPAPERGQQ